MTTPKAQFEDRDLMRYYDGELDDEQAADLEAWLDAEEDAHDKLAGLDMVGDMLREMADEDHGVDDIVDAVMAGLDEDAESADEAEENADVDAALDQQPVLPKTEAANDNSSWIFMMAGVAAAAAAGLFLWGKQPAPEPTAMAPAAPTATEAVPAPSAPSPAPETLADDEPEGVQIAAVDFGAHQGSVFYVSGGKSQSAVVWITDTGEQ